MDQNMQWMPMVVSEGKVFLRADGIFEFIDSAVKNSNTPKREKEVLLKLKKVFKQFEQMAFDAQKGKKNFSFDA